MGKKRSYAQNFPGKYKKYLSDKWYLCRMGFTDDEGNDAPGSGELWAAFDHYKEYFLPDGITRYCAFETIHWRYGYQSYPGNAPTNGSRTNTHPTRVRRAGTDDNGRDLYETRLGEKHLLSHFWKGRISTMGGYSALEDALLAPSHVEDHPEVLGMYPIKAAGTEQSTMPDERCRYQLPNAEKWIRVSTGTENLNYFVIDVDFKSPENEELFDALMQFLTRTRGLPRPHLIVTSKSGLGRHLYYFFDDYTSEEYNESSDQAKWTKLFRDKIEAIGVAFEPGELEIFPGSNAKGIVMPSLPFGACSWLCDSKGNIISKDPLESLVLWHQRKIKRPIHKHLLTRRKIKRIDAKLVRSQLPDLLIERGRNKSKQKQKPQNVQQDEYPDYEPTTSADGPTTKEAEDILKRGPRRSHTNDDLMLLARYLKHNLGLNRKEFIRRLEEWVSLAVDQNHLMSEYQNKIADLWNSAQFHLPYGDPTFKLCPEDADYIARKILSWKIPKRKDRKALTVMMLGLIGIARSRNPKAKRICHNIPVHCRWMRDWRSDYADGKEELIRRGWLKIDRESEKENSFTLGRMTEYAIPITKGTNPITFNSHKDNWIFFIENLNPLLGVKMAGGTRNWKNWVQSVKQQAVNATTQS